MAEKLWAEWLRESLDSRGWKQADLVRESDGLIKADRVSKWLAGKESPSHKLALVAANALAADQNEALHAAGFSHVVLASQKSASADAAQGDGEARAAQSRSEARLSRLGRLLNGIPDSEILHVLQRRAEGRELRGQWEDDFRVNVTDVGGSGDPAESRKQSDYARVADEMDQNDETGEDQDIL